MEKDFAVIRFIVHAYDKEKFVNECNELGIKPTSKIRELMLHLLHTKSIDSFVRKSHVLRQGMFITQSGGQGTFSVRVTKEDRDAFYEECRRWGYTPSFVLRYIVQDFCDKASSIDR